MANPFGKGPLDRIADAFVENNIHSRRIAIALESIEKKIGTGTSGGGGSDPELKAILLDIQGKVGALAGAQQDAINRMAEQLRKQNDRTEDSLKDTQ